MKSWIIFVLIHVFNNFYFRFFLDVTLLTETIFFFLDKKTLSLIFYNIP